MAQSTPESDLHVHVHVCRESYVLGKQLYLWSLPVILTALILARRKANVS